MNFNPLLNFGTVTLHPFMLFKSMIRLIIVLCSSFLSAAYDCVPNGRLFSNGFKQNNVACTTTLNDLSYYFNSDFTRDINEFFNVGSMYFDGSITFNNNGPWWDTKYFYFLQNSRVAMYGLLHSNIDVQFKSNSILLIFGMFSIKNKVSFESTPLIDYPPMVLWISYRCHLYNPTFTIVNPTGNSRCFDTISFWNLRNVLDYDPSAKDNYNSTHFPITMTYGKAYLISNKRLIRFCPTGTNFDNKVTCVMNGTYYSSQYYGYGSYSFTYPHCPCNDATTDCHLKFDQTKSNFDMGYSELLKTTIHVSHATTLNYLKTTKEILVEDNSMLTIGSYSEKNIIKLSNFEIESVGNIFSTYKFETTTNTLNIEGTNTIKQIANKNGNILVIKGSGIITFSQTTVKTVFSVKRLSTNNLLNLLFSNDNNIKNDLFFIEEGINTPFKNCSVISSDTNGIEECEFCQNGNVLSVDKKCETKRYCEELINNRYCYKCEYGYIFNDNYLCIFSSGCLIGNSSYCQRCKDGYELNNGICSINTKCIKSERNYCIKCESGNNLNKCEECGNGCELCYNNKCTICKDGFILQEDGSCLIKDESANITTQTTIITCKDGYYIENGRCNECIDSSYCTINKHFKCEEGYRIENHFCISKTCESGETKDSNGKCRNVIDKCQDNLIVNERCVECENGSYPNINGVCITTQIEHCIGNNTIGCKRCSDGYYLDSNLQCQICSNECVTCIKSSDYCLSCENGKYLSNHNCLSLEGLNETCQLLLPDGSGCAICKSGYYREQKGCETCLKSCQTCNRNTTCLECKDGYFMKNGGQCKSINETEGCEVEIDKQLGCIRCQDGYYKIDNECYKCQTPCLSCSNEKECDTCIDEYVIDNHQCVSYHQISHCIDTKQSKCSECSFWYQPSSDGTYCETQPVWWIIVLIVLVILLIVALFVIGIYYLLNYLIRRKQRKQQQEIATIFLIERSNIKFISLGDNIVVNMTEIKFNEGIEIPVDKEHRELMCIGNTSKKTMKIQITTKEGVDKYSIRTNPQLIILKKGEACEFEIFTTVKCTCQINDKIMIIGKSMNKSNNEIIKSITIDVKTEFSSRLDYDEIKEDKKLGEGSFGIVYLGNFRGNKVAIKKIKEIQDEGRIEEFEKEVSMLYKFRSDYIIHFYGACFIPNKICMVTEFAQFGSLQDLMRKGYIQPRLLIRIKMMIDSAKGIEYLHSNGILHRDIKPDNILVLSLDENVSVNAKLTDFGSARNVNMLMTNMTFTKGIGTPTYMAPEILDRRKYKMPSDVYSFAITMYECFKWEECYPKSLFKFSWNIAEFVTAGKRRPTESLPNNIQKLLEDSWKHNPKERMTIKGIIENLEQTL